MFYCLRYMAAGFQHLKKLNAILDFCCYEKLRTHKWLFIRLYQLTFTFVILTLNLLDNRYHIPREWLKSTDNLLVLFEETGGDPTKISLELHYTQTVCSQVSENDYPPLSAWSDRNILNEEVSVSSIPPQAYLHCDDGHVISSITFASYGTPSGSCQQFSQGRCHAANSPSLVTEVSAKAFGTGFYIYI